MATRTNSLEVDGAASPGSAREARARSRSAARLHRQRSALRPLGLAVAVAVVIASTSATPRPSLHGTGLAVTASLLVFLAMLVLTTSPRAIERQSHAAGVLAIAALGTAGLALVGLQPHGATELAAGAAVFMAAARLPIVVGAAIAALIVVGLDIALASTGSGTSAVLAATVLCALLAVVAYFIRQSRDGQARSELLLAQLEDAREEQIRAAATEERGRIAGELHDVLAHSLSGAAIQLQGARMLAEHENAAAEIRDAIDRAADLVKEGLANARSAVGALRGDDLPSVTRIPELIESFRANLKAEATFKLEGSPRPLPPDASLALFRGAQEALTNVARYAPGARTTVTLHYGPVTTLCVENVAADVDLAARLDVVGGSRGLDGMRERIERAGGTMSAGPTKNGWRVELEIPL